MVTRAVAEEHAIIHPKSDQVGVIGPVGERRLHFMGAPVSDAYPEIIPIAGKSGEQSVAIFLAAPIGGTSAEDGFILLTYDAASSKFIPGAGRVSSARFIREADVFAVEFVGATPEIGLLLATGVARSQAFLVTETGIKTGGGETVLDGDYPQGTMVTLYPHHNPRIVVEEGIEVLQATFGEFLLENVDGQRVPAAAPAKAVTITPFTSGTGFPCILATLDDGMTKRVLVSENGARFVTAQVVFDDVRVEGNGVVGTAGGIRYRVCPRTGKVTDMSDLSALSATGGDRLSRSLAGAQDELRTGTAAVTSKITALASRQKAGGGPAADLETIQIKAAEAEGLHRRGTRWAVGGVLAMVVSGSSAAVAVFGDFTFDFLQSIAAFGGIAVGGAVGFAATGWGIVLHLRGRAAAQEGVQALDRMDARMRPLGLGQPDQIGGSPTAAPPLA